MRRRRRRRRRGRREKRAVKPRDPQPEVRERINALKVFQCRRHIKHTKDIVVLPCVASDVQESLTKQCVPAFSAF